MSCCAVSKFFLTNALTINNSWRLEASLPFVSPLHSCENHRRVSFSLILQCCTGFYFHKSDELGLRIWNYSFENNHKLSFYFCDVFSEIEPQLVMKTSRYQDLYSKLLAGYSPRLHSRFEITVSPILLSWTRTQWRKCLTIWIQTTNISPDDTQCVYTSVAFSACGNSFRSVFHQLGESERHDEGLLTKRIVLVAAIYHCDIKLRLLSSFSRFVQHDHPVSIGPGPAMVVWYSLGPHSENLAILRISDLSGKFWRIHKRREIVFCKRISIW
jgi:hypothetical protein